VARILFLTQVLPYPKDSGAKIRAYYVLRQLASNHEVHLVSFVRADDRPAYVNHLLSFCKSVHTVPMRRSPWRNIRALWVAGWTGRSAIIVRDEIGEMHAKLGQLIEDEFFDIVHADQTSMAQYALYVKEGSANSRDGTHLRLILDAHNALYRIPERLATHEHNSLKQLLYRREARALACYEADVYRDFDHVVAVTEDDRQILQRLVADHSSADATSALSSSTIPICVDPEEQPMVDRTPSPRAITHLGTMFWPPNVEGVRWFTRKIFPRVLEQVPEARLVIIGKNPPKEILALEGEFSSVEITGYVADPHPYLAETAAFIVPVRSAGGMRVKIVDAWCWGVPTISTTIGAEGIEVRDGENILIADTVEAFANAVSRLLQEPALGKRLRSNGRRWVEEQYDWRKVYPKWDEVYQEVLSH